MFNELTLKFMENEFTDTFVSNKKKILQFMMRTFMLLFCTTVFGFSSPDIFSQNTKVVIDEDKIATIDEIFDLLREQTDYTFIYQEDFFKNAAKVHLKKGKIRANKLLRKCFSGDDFNFTINDNNKIIIDKIEPVEEPEQEIQISGTVKDNRGQPLPGANILEKGTTNGTQTDFDGKFVLDVKDENAILVVSYIGFATQEIAVAGKTTISVTMAAAAAGLDEVVVIGYGTSKKADLTGAVSRVAGETLTVTSNTSVASILQGKLSGVNISKSGRPGSGTSFNIRGIGSFGTNVDNSPLVVIDGVPVQGGMETLNPNDIESVNLLKDASSAAIYGSRAANGVILITTKSGREGNGKITVNLYSGIQSPARKIDMLSPEQFLDAAKEGISNQEISTGNDIISPLETATYEDLGHVDWVDQAFTSAPVVDLSISTSGGSEKVKYYVSGEYLSQDGIGPESGYDKFSARLNLDANVKTWLRIGNNFHVSHQVVNGAGNGQQAALTQAGPYWDKIRNEDGTLAGPNALGLSIGGVGNPLISYEVNNISTTYLRFLDNFYAEAELMENLKLKFNGAYDLTYTNYKNYQPKYNIGGSQRDRNQYQEYRDFDNMWLAEFILSYSKTIGKHKISGLVAHSRQLYTTDNNMRGLVKDFASDAENMQVLSGGTNRDESDVTGSKTELAIASYFGRLNYDFDNKYLLSFNLRMDGSSRFAEDYRWGVFPSVSGAWKISDEEFFNVKGVNFLKLRASWGQLGNQSVGTYYPTSVSINKKNTVFGPRDENQKLNAGYVQDALSNNKLEWETTQITNIGVDLELFDRHFNISADYFDKVTDGILRGMVIPINVGLNPPIINFAKVKNEGADMELTYNDHVGDFNFGIGFNASYVKNEILELSDDVDQELGSLPWNGLTINKVGESLNSFYGYRTDGLFTSQAELDAAPDQINKRLGLPKYVDTNKDGKIDADDMAVLGNSIPKWNLGSTITANWNNFDFMMVWMAVLGRDQHQPQQIASMYPPGSNMLVKRYENRYQLDQPYVEGMYPALYWTNVYQGSYDTMFIKNGFGRMKTVTVGYTLNLKDQVSARLFVTGENLITITSDGFLGIDPENNFGDGKGSYFAWGDGFPNPKILMIGLNLNF